MTNIGKAPQGTLIIIGGHEEKEDNSVILNEVVKRANRRHGPLIVTAVASQLADEVVPDYVALFKRLGAKDIAVLDIRTRDDAYSTTNVELIARAGAIFFTGGDQLRITSMLGGTSVYEALRTLYTEHGLIVGTSAGAAAMSSVMLAAGTNDKSHVHSDLDIAPGLGFLNGVVIDSHFSERGRLGRLLGAVAQNPLHLGIGIDEDTAIIVNADQCFQVLGSGAVYIVDGTKLSYTNVSDRRDERVLAAFDIKLHVLAAGYQYNLAERQPIGDDPTETQGDVQK